MSWSHTFRDLLSYLLRIFVFSVVLHDINRRSTGLCQLQITSRISIIPLSFLMFLLLDGDIHMIIFLTVLCPDSWFFCTRLAYFSHDIHPSHSISWNHPILFLMSDELSVSMTSARLKSIVFVMTSTSLRSVSYVKNIQRFMIWSYHTRRSNSVMSFRSSSSLHDDPIFVQFLRKSLQIVIILRTHEVVIAVKHSDFITDVRVCTNKSFQSRISYSTVRQWRSWRNSRRVSCFVSSRYQSFWC